MSARRPLPVPRDLNKGPAASMPETGATPVAAEAPGRTGVVGALVSTTILIGYPLLAWIGISYLGTRTAAVLLLVALGASQLRRLTGRPGALRGLTWLALAVVGLLALAALFDDPRFILAYPTLVNLVLLSQFGWSLRSGPPMVERFARLQVDDLSQAELAYCRAITAIWCGFFVLNGLTSALLAIWGTRSAWALYSGLIAYLLMGLLFAAEYLVRKARFGRFGPGLVDRLVERLVGPGARK